MQTEVLIVGAGPTGLVLALWLARLGIQVRIIDRSPGPGVSALQPPFPIEPRKAPSLDAATHDAELGAEFSGAYRFTERALGFGWQAQVYGRAGAPLREACAEWGLDLKAFDWTPAAGQAGLVRDAIYLVRPDGYVSFASRSQSAAALATHLQRFEIRFRSVPGTGGALCAGLGAPQAPGSIS